MEDASQPARISNEIDPIDERSRPDEPAIVAVWRKGQQRVQWRSLGQDLNLHEVGVREVLQAVKNTMRRDAWGRSLPQRSRTPNRARVQGAETTTGSN